MGKRSTWTSKDDDQLRTLSCGIWRELRSDRCAAESHCSWCSQTGYGLGRPVGRLEERVAAEGETVGIFPWPNIVNFQDRLDQKTKYFERMDLTAKMIPLMDEAVEKMAALGADREHIIRFLQATIEEMREQ